MFSLPYRRRARRFFRRENISTECAEEIETPQKCDRSGFNSFGSLLSLENRSAFVLSQPFIIVIYA